MKKCNDCGKCCQFSSGFLAENDKENIAKHLKISVNELEKIYLEKTRMFGTEAWRPKFPKPFGPCIFFNKKKHCTINNVKPMLCKLASCKEDVTNVFYKKYFVKKGSSDNKFEAQRIKQSQDEWKLREEVKNG